MNGRRGSTLVESTMVTATFLLMLVGIMEFGRLGFAYNSITFAARRAARFASTRGSGSGHAASLSDIQAMAQANTVALDSSALGVGVTWTPANDNSPGSQVQVQVTYNFKPLLIPLSASAIQLKSTAVLTITQ